MVRFGVTVMVLLAALAAGCGSGTGGADGGAGGEEDGPLRIGVVIPLSGATAEIGEQVRSGYELARQEINQGGGIGGRQLEFVYADHTGDPATGAREARRLIRQEGVAALTGSYESGVTIVVAQTAEQAQVPYLVPYSSATSITNSGFRYTFRTRPALPVWSQTMVEFLTWQADNGGVPVDRVGLLVDDTEYGQTAAEAYENAAERAGLEVSSTETFEQGETNLAPQATRLRSGGADAILAASYLQSSIGAIRTLDSLDFRVPYMTVGTGIVAPGFFDLGPLAEGVTSSTSWASTLESRTSESSQAFDRRFREQVGRPPTDDAAYAYSAAFVLEEAVEKGDGASPAAITETLRTGEFTSPQANVIPAEGGSISFDEKGQANTTIVMAQAQGDEWVVVFPEEFAAAELETGGAAGWYSG